MSAKHELVRVNIDRDRNDNGELKWLVTAYYRVNGRVMSIPDSRGWDTKEEAEAEATRIRESGSNRSGT